MYAFVVSIILFSVGGVFSIYEGIDKLQHPHALEVPWLPLLVLAIAIVLECFSLRTAVRESNHVRGKQCWVEFVRHAKAPELPVVLLEDIAALIGLVFALIGVGLTIITGNPIWDAIGTLAIGVLLITVAVILGIETKSLLVGEGANPDDASEIRDAINANAEGRGAHPHEDPLPRPGRAARRREGRAREDHQARGCRAAINDVEQSIREAVPVARVIYLEPDVYVGEVREPVDRRDRDQGRGLARTCGSLQAAAQLGATRPPDGPGRTRQQGRALGLEHAADHLDAVRQPPVAQQVVRRCRPRPPSRPTRRTPPGRCATAGSRQRTSRTARA